MQKPTRRQAITALPGTAVASLLASHSGIALAAHLPVVDTETFLIGPFLLGDWYKKTCDDFPSGIPAPEWFRTDPGHKTLIEGLNKCKLFIFDARDKKSGEFAKGDYPLLLIGGDIAFDWEDKERKAKLSVRLNKLAARLNHTNRTEDGWNRAVYMSVCLDMQHKSPVDGGSCTYCMVSENIWYDVNGKRVAGK